MDESSSTKRRQYRLVQSLNRQKSDQVHRTTEQSYDAQRKSDVTRQTAGISAEGGEMNNPKRGYGSARSSEQSVQRRYTRPACCC